MDMALRQHRWKSRCAAVPGLVVGALFYTSAWVLSQVWCRASEVHFLKFTGCYWHNSALLD